MKALTIFLFLWASNYAWAQEQFRPRRPGLIPPTLNDIRAIPYETSGRRPPVAKLDSVDLSPRMPPAGDQGYHQGSCVGWAIAYATVSYNQMLKTVTSKQKGDFRFYDVNDPSGNFKTVFSPTFIYNSVMANRDSTNGDCSGIKFIEAFKVLENYGVVPWAQLKYSVESEASCLEPNPIRVDSLTKKAAEYRNVATNLIINENSIKYHISTGKPVLIGMAVTYNFDEDGDKAGRNKKKFVWDPDTTALPYVNHAMVCVGYNNRLHEFKVLNSYGQSWGTDGYVYIPYLKFIKFAREAYVLGNVFEFKKLISESKPLSNAAAKKNFDLIVSDSASVLNTDFKVGIHRELSNIKMSLSYLNDAHDLIVVQFRDTKNDSIIQNIQYNLGESKTFVYEGKVYSFQFKSADPLSNTKPNVKFEFILSNTLNNNNPSDTIIDKYENDQVLRLKKLEELRNELNKINGEILLLTRDNETKI